MLLAQKIETLSCVHFLLTKTHWKSSDRGGCFEVHHQCHPSQYKIQLRVHRSPGCRRNWFTSWWNCPRFFLDVFFFFLRCGFDFEVSDIRISGFWWNLGSSECWWNVVQQSRLTFEGGVQLGWKWQARHTCWSPCDPIRELYGNHIRYSVLEFWQHRLN